MIGFQILPFLKSFVTDFSGTMKARKLKVCIKIDNGSKKVCVHNIYLTNGWNLTELAQIHHKDGANKRLDFGDLDLIFKITTL